MNKFGGFWSTDRQAAELDLNPSKRLAREIFDRCVGGGGEPRGSATAANIPADPKKPLFGAQGLIPLSKLSTMQ